MQKMDLKDIAQTIDEEKDVHTPVSENEYNSETWDAPLFQALIYKRDASKAIAQHQTDQDEFKASEKGLFRHFDEEKLRSFLSKTIGGVDDIDDTLEDFKARYFSSQSLKNNSDGNDDVEYSPSDDLEFKYSERYRALEKLVNYSDDKDYLDALIDNWDKLKELHSDRIDSILEHMSEANLYAKQFMWAYNQQQGKYVQKVKEQVAKAHPETDYIDKYLQEELAKPEHGETIQQILSKMLANKDSYIFDASPYEIAYADNHLSDKDKSEILGAFADKDTPKNRFLSALKYDKAEKITRAAIHQYLAESNWNTNAPLFEMVDYGISTFKQAQKCAEAYFELNDRPETYNSPYNKYEVKEIARFVSRLYVEPTWMYPILFKAQENGIIDVFSERIPSERTLFDACRTWKVCSKMPLRLAKKVGQYSLEGRIIAGAVFDKISQEKGIEGKDWLSDKELQTEFYSTLSQYFKMDRDDALKQLSNYIGRGNRKRLIAELMEKAGFEYNDTRFDVLYDITHLYKSDEKFANHQDMSFDEFKKQYLSEEYSLDEVIQSHISVAQKLSAADDETFSYAVENFSEKQLLETDLYYNQQNIANILKEAGLESVSVSSNYDDNEDNVAISGSFNAANIFGNNFTQYFEKVRNYYSAEDAVYWLPQLEKQEDNQEFAQFILDNILYTDREEKIVARKPKVMEFIAEVWQKPRKNAYIDNNIVSDAFVALLDIADEKETYRHKALTVLNNAIASNCVGDNDIEVLCKKLEQNISQKPDMADELLEVYNRIVLRHERHKQYSSYAYTSMEKIAENNLILVPNIIANAEKLIRDSNCTPEMLKHSYIMLGKILDKHPEYANKIFTIFNIGINSSKNDEDSLKELVDILKHKITKKESTLEGLVRNLEYTIPPKEDFSTEVLSTLGNISHSSKANIFVLNRIYYALNDIVKDYPDLSKEVLSTTISCDNLSDKIDIYKSCMKHLPLEETISKHPEIEQDLRVAHKGRFASDEEFRYALEYFDKAKLADSMIFSAQQRVMNVLVSASTQENDISKEEALSFRKPDAPKVVKDYMRNNNDWLIPASFKGAAIFKEYFPAYIKTIQNHNQKNPEDKLSIHDAVYWLPEPMSKEANFRFAQFIQKNIIYQTIDASGKHKMVHRPLSELKIIAQNWKALENRLQNQGDNSDITKLKYNDVLSICMSVKYEDQRNDVFAVEAAKHGTPEAEYHNCEDIYLAGLKVPEPFDSKKEFKEGKYTGRFLPREDPRTLFFGDYTDCCQHYGGAGHACAVSTVKHPFSQLFVIEDDKGKIIAGSWTWENTEGKYREVCFDNIESLGELKSRPEINKIYEQVGNYLTKEEICRRVTIGLGYQDADVSGYSETEAVSLPKLYGNDGTNSYSDAHSQVLLCENPNAEPLDKTQESQRYIRDVCFLDMEAMDRVSEAVFPDGDKQLQAPDNMAGFVIEDREKGVVGYCLYDKEEKSIYDMAVLPEYRTDKNASSRKLFAEMMRTINKEGGKWSAEMRDETTLRYLKAMADRGLVKYEEHGIDHTMSDGSKVVAVTFEPIRRDVLQAKNRIKQHIDAGKETSKSTQSATITNGRVGRDYTGYE